ncbi:energy-coupling factor transporter transmembrane protein EcfT [Alkalihalobacillus sp. AL-G]|uniref:energy-coupling factor transporter transmembrane component T family protein n=1 Tax=Alkalihalobacillus sp. AL-G TaxID=2926399 RepID=UPI00272AB364|nr:energy-coupling factor transporter transmembrane component T [Alkalihalobacillus sp. AL-G]WLD93892.1 energy-coupling factor transporter transmembrane protein EcfT [Alkalihalobacillus sp. AL-G]
MNLDFTHKKTWLYRINPSLKLFVMVLLFIGVLLVHQLNLILYITVAALLLLVLFSGHPPKRLALLSIPFIVVFVSTASSMILFGKGETTWFKWGLIHITEESFYRGIHIGFRALVYAALGLMFALTTRPVFLFYSLMQQMKLSPKYAYSFMAGFRLIPIMFEEFQTIRNAMIVRGVQQQKGIRSFYFKLKSYSIPLLSQSIRRAHRIAVSMEAKRFSEVKERTYYYKIGFSLFDVLFIVSLAALITASFMLAELAPIFPTWDVRH